MIRPADLQPHEAVIDWSAFADVICCTRWSRPVDLARDCNLSQSTTMNAWQGKSIGLLPFLRICRAMNVPADKFLVEGKADAK